jgi:hypothetical protein
MESRPSISPYYHEIVYCFVVHCAIDLVGEGLPRWKEVSLDPDRIA